MRTCKDGCNGCDERTDHTPSAANVRECSDNDSPWLVCKPCNAAGRCAKADPPTRESVSDALLIVESYGPWGPDLNDAHRRQIVLADEVKRMTGTAEALQAEWDRECGDTDKILRLLGLAPENCRTDGGSLKLQMVLGALEHRDVMVRREARKAERERCAALCGTVAQNTTAPQRQCCAENLAQAIRKDQP